MALLGGANRDRDRGASTSSSTPAAVAPSQTSQLQSESDLTILLSIPTLIRQARSIIMMATTRMSRVGLVKLIGKYSLPSYTIRS
jgi:hypothetical protein